MNFIPVTTKLPERRIIFVCVSNSDPFVTWQTVLLVTATVLLAPNKSFTRVTMIRYEMVQAAVSRASSRVLGLRPSSFSLRSANTLQPRQLPWNEAPQRGSCQVTWQTCCSRYQIM